MPVAIKEYPALSGADLERFRAKIHEAGPDECWEWVAARTTRGYGTFSVGGRAGGDYAAHRLAYVVAYGPLSPTVELDHTCKNKGCVNPAHLEPVTHRENCIRAETPIAENARREFCSLGHSLTERRSDGRRTCGVCR